jgi:hypothetical protein
MSLDARPISGNDPRANGSLATSKTSPSADRTIRILNFLADRPWT